MRPTYESWLSDAILRTLIYADVFHFPLTLAELQHFLIAIPSTVGDQPASPSLADVEAALAELRSQIVFTAPYFTLVGSEAFCLERTQRDSISRSLWQYAQRFGRVLASLPFVRMVAVTGSLAMRNAAHAQDDIDYLIVTTSGRVWLTRLLAVGIVRIAKLQGIGLCPNYVLAESALEQRRQDLFIAHEIAQMIPLAGFDRYELMRSTNQWTSNWLPFATTPFYNMVEGMPRGAAALLKRALEWLLGGALGTWLDAWEQRRKQIKFAKKFAAQATHSGSQAQLDHQHAKGHFKDHGQLILEQYQLGLRKWGLSPAPLSFPTLAEPETVEVGTPWLLAGD